MYASCSQKYDFKIYYTEFKNNEKLLQEELIKNISCKIKEIILKNKIFLQVYIISSKPIVKCELKWKGNEFYSKFCYRINKNLFFILFTHRGE